MSVLSLALEVTSSFGLIIDPDHVLQRQIVFSGVTFLRN